MRTKLLTMFATIAMLLCSVTMSAQSAFDDWTSTNAGEASSTSSCEYQFTAEAGYTICFDWEVSSEQNCDWLIIKLNGTELVKKSGNQSGSFQNTFITAGEYTLTAEYTKDGGVDHDGDYGKVMNIFVGVASGTYLDSFKWALSVDGELRITGSGDMPMENVNSSAYPWYSYKEQIRSITIGNGVTSIGYEAFCGYNSLTSITIPEGVTSIGQYAFLWCSNLENITIPASVTSIYGGAFANCSNLESITIPKGVTTIAHYVFAYCSSLKSISLPDGVTTIEHQTFEGCSSLESITIPASVTSIYVNSFSRCDNLTTITVAEGNTVYDSREGCNAIIETSSNTLIAGCKTTVIPASVTSIGQYAFAYCYKLESITIPEGVTSIGECAFNGCNSLTAITVAEGNTVYDSREGCNAIIETSSNTLIAGCKTTVIPMSVTSIEDYAFYCCSSLESITIHASVTSIGQYAFDGTAWYNNQPDGVVYCDNWVLGYKGYMPSNIEINAGTKGVAGGAFLYCSSLESINIPEGVTWIGSGVFYGCSSLASITLPAGVTSIGDHAFSYCSNLKSITLPAGVTSIGDYAFSDCSSLESITLLEGLTSIGGYAFYNCSSLESIAIPDGVTEIAHFTFQGCSKLESIAISGSVTKIDWCAFESCESLKSITIPEGVTEIGGSAFLNCTNLTSVTLSESVTELSQTVFCNCSSLESINIPEGVTKINYGLFSGCSSLESINIPEGVTEIGGEVFSGCSSLASINIPEGVTWIGSEAFSGCSSLASITCLTSEPLSVEENVFDGVDKSACVLRVPVVSAEAYANTSPWNEFAQVPLYKVTRMVDGEVIDVRWETEGTTVTLPSMRSMEGYTFSGWELHEVIDIEGRMSDADMTNPQGSVLYTNAHCTYERWNDQFTSWAVLFDGNANTFFHSEYKPEVNSIDGEHHYLRVDVGEPISQFYFTYTVRGDQHPYYTPTEIIVEGANEPDGTYTEIATVTGLPTITGAVYESPLLSNGNAYRYIRYRVTNTYYNVMVEGHPYFYFAEFGMDKGSKIESESFEVPAGNVVIKGRYLKHYTVNFVCAGDTILSEEVPYSTAIAQPEAPERDDLYTFVEWSECPTTMPAHDVLAVAKYDVVLNDGELQSFSHAGEEEMASITYTRTLPNMLWNALYVPFEIELTEELLADYDVAYFNDVHSYDRDNDGDIDDMEMEVIELKGGTLKANHPYLLRAKNEEAMEMELFASDATLYSTLAEEQDTLVCSSVYMNFEVTGTYNTLAADMLEGGYAITAEGKWQPVAADASLNPFRLYLTMIVLDGSPVKIDEQAMQAISIRTRGESEGTTSIDNGQLTIDNESTIIYDLQGRRVTQPGKGVYIVNGKKVVL